jgi:hypothetical protein
MSTLAVRHVVALLALSLLPAAAHAEARAKVAVFQGKPKGGPNLAATAKPLVDKPLSAFADIVPPPQVQKAAKKLKLKPKDLQAPATFAQAAKEAGAAYVLVIEGGKQQATEGKKKKMTPAAVVTLLRTANGEVAYNGTFPLKGKKLTKDVADDIFAALKGVLATPVSEAVTEAAPAPEPVPAPPPPTPTLAAAPVALPPEPPPPAPAPEPAPVVQQPAAELEPVVASAPAPRPVAAPPKPAPEPTLTVSETQPGRAGSLRNGFAASIGGYGFVRRAEIKDSSGLKPLTYGGSLPLPAAMLKVELYPLSFGGSGAWYEGAGIDAEGTFSQTVTEVSRTPKQTVKSVVVSGRGGVSMRLVFWDAPTAIDLKLRGGYGFSQFPLEKTAFPGLRYMAPYAGATLTVPFVEQFGLVIGGTYAFSPTLGDGAKNLGKAKSASGFNAEAGFRVVVAPWRIDLVGRIDQFDGTFTGTTNLEGVAQYTDAKLSDRYLGGYLTAGIEL